MKKCSMCGSTRVAYAAFNHAFYAVPANMEEPGVPRKDAGYTADDRLDLANKDIDVECFVCLVCGEFWREEEKPVIVECNCRHEYQDRQHGKGKRMANPTQGGNGAEKAYRCSVCGALHKK